MSVEETNLYFCVADIARSLLRAVIPVFPAGLNSFCLIYFIVKTTEQIKYALHDSMLINVEH